MSAAGKRDLGKLARRGKEGRPAGEPGSLAGHTPPCPIGCCLDLGQTGRSEHVGALDGRPEAAIEQEDWIFLLLFFMIRACVFRMAE
jgi:hypothetical protein